MLAIALETRTTRVGAMLAIAYCPNGIAPALYALIWII